MLVSDWTLFKLGFYMLNISYIKYAWSFISHSPVVLGSFHEQLFITLNNNNNKYLYIALSCVTQSDVTQNE